MTMKLMLALCIKSINRYLCYMNEKENEKQLRDYWEQFIYNIYTANFMILAFDSFLSLGLSSYFPTTIYSI